MRRISNKRRNRQAEAKPFRDALVASVGHCERCHKTPKQGVRLCVHEISNGPLRQKSLDQPYAVLVLCWGCNGLATDKGRWSEAAQLRCLLESRPDHYDLVAYNYLVRPNAPDRITQDDVDQS